MIFNVKLPDSPLIVDSGASVCITPHRRDFKPGTYTSSKMKIRDLSGVNKVHGEGIIQWPAKDSNDNTVLIEVPGFHLDSTEVRLLSPQVLQRSVPGSGFTMIDGKSSILLPGDHIIRAPVSNRSNLPEMLLSTDPVLLDSTFGVETFGFGTDLSDVWNAHFNVCKESNTNLRQSKKELLLWQHRLSHFNLGMVHSLLRDTQWLRVHDQPDSALHNGPILCSKYPSSKSSPREIKCAACLMAKACLRTPQGPRAAAGPVPDKVLKTSHLAPGQCISCDHYVSPTKGRNLDGYGKATASNGYTGGAIYVDHASGKIFHFPQTSLSASETLRGKQSVERAATDLGFRVKSYHSDNGIFASAEFQAHCGSLPM
eukprot:scaffold9457_cov86-Cyclotella_meneghiniana.AAC.2